MAYKKGLKSEGHSQMFIDLYCKMVVEPVDNNIHNTEFESIINNCIEELQKWWLRLLITSTYNTKFERASLIVVSRNFLFCQTLGKVSFEDK